MLSGRLPDKDAEYPPPIFGVDYRLAREALQPGQAALLQNCYWDGGVRIRLGSTRLTTASLGAFGGRGAHRFYFSASSKQRLIAYSTKISKIDDAGIETVLNSAMTSDLDTHFTTWSITDACYITNGTDTLRKYDGTTFSTVIGTNVPTPIMVRPMVDRLFGVQGGGVVWTNPRSDSVWSPTTSSWAFFKPVGGGNVTALHLHSTTGKQGDPLAQMLVFQGGAVSAITSPSGAIADFGADVTALTPTATFNGTLVLLDPSIGTNSPYSIVTIPGLGTFWLDQRLRVVVLRFGERTPRVVSEPLFSNQPEILGLNNINVSALGQAVSVYHDQKLKVFIPVGSDTFNTLQYWLDVRPLFFQLIEFPAHMVKVAWSGPHSGQSLRRVWVEGQAGDNDAIYGLEGNSATGMFVYTLNAAGTYKDAVGLVDNPVLMTYRTIYHGFGWDARAKYIPVIHLAGAGTLSQAAVALRNLYGTVVPNLSITQVNGSAFTYAKYSNLLKYSNSVKYSGGASTQLGLVDIPSQSTLTILNGRIAVDVIQGSGSNLIVNQVIPEVKVLHYQPVIG